MVIISGTGRSGTKMIHALLKELGVSIGEHEQSPGIDGGVGGYRVIKKLTPVGNLNWKVFNQMRHPLEVIKSSYTSNNLMDYPELDLYRNKISKEYYLMKLWFKINSYLCEISEFSYTLEQLNSGTASKKLIEEFNIHCTEEVFMEALAKVKSDSNQNNTRKQSKRYGNHIDESFLRKLDSDLYDECLELYNKINTQ